ncbi:MAG: nuclear transport factor 2 family protein [Acidobacteriota bacterium]|nr:nuclear transport factor 2 family protein [Acidobacteriota bacterium]
MKKVLILLACGLICAGILTALDSSSEEAAVRAAVLDYVEGVYNVQPERIDRSVHKSLRKHGFYKNEKGEWQEVPMTFERLRNLAGNWNKDGKRANAKSPKEITIFEVKNKTASAKLVAEWGQDYFHLGKYDGKWMITNVIWQSLD